MKKNILSLFIFLFAFSGLNAQINLIGSSASQNPDVISVVKWQALESTSVTSYPTAFEAYLFGSSVFDAWNGNYFLTGISNDTAGILSFNSTTNTQTISSYTAFSNITEIDMSTGKIYNMTSDSVGYFSINEYDIATGTDSLLGVIIEPGIPGIIADATGFDSNNGILYYIGADNSPAACLYSIPVRDAVFSYKKTILTTVAPFNNFSSVNYDNINNTIFALNSQFDTLGNFTGNSVIEIDNKTGLLIPRGELQEFPYYVAGSSSFDQNTSSLLLVGIDTNFMARMIVFNTIDNTYEAGFVPGNVSEIVCDNSAFARNTYSTTSVQEAESIGVKLYPNPASDQIILTNLPASATEIQITIRNSTGQLVLNQNYKSLQQLALNVSALKPGNYLLQIKTNASVETKKLVII